MKKSLAALGLLMIVLIGCSPTSSQESEEKNSDETQEEVENSEESGTNTDQESTDSESDDGESEDQGSTTETKKDDSKKEDRVNALRPSEGMLKVFKQTGGYTLKEKVIATNEQYVQRLLVLGDMKTMQVLKWDTNEIKKVYEISNPQNEQENILDSFKAVDNTEILLSESNVGNGDQSEWQIVEDNVEIKTPYETFENTIVVQRTFTEGKNETIHTVYYAPDYGMVKEIYDVTGDNGYKVETELESVEQN